MPKRTDIKSILILGAGPIVIGQACEFDYSGAQACKALREEGYRVILVNSNPATIMTDPEMADATYIEPIHWEVVRKIIEKERPDAVLPTMGGQTALNCALELERQGVLEEFGVTMIGATADAIDKAEDRRRFDVAMKKIGLETARSGIAHTMEEALAVAADVGFPCIIRPSFTMGGSGGGIAYNREEFEEICARGLDLSPTKELLIDESLIGWKEYEMEVVRDKNDNCIIVCSIENFDAMGIHTGDSITVAPAQTLTDKEYQIMRNASMAVLREIGVETGGSNVQFAVNPKNGRLIVIEMNPRGSRSSALASKATGFPIAKIAARLAVGYTLDEIPNDITLSTPASFEPTLDYVVVKAPRFAFEKFPASDPTLTTTMKSVGEAMAIGRNFTEALQKALRSLDKRGSSFDFAQPAPNPEQTAQLLEQMATPTERRLTQVVQAIRGGASAADIYAATKIDPWFIDQLFILCEVAQRLREAPALQPQLLREAKRHGFSDLQIAQIRGISEDTVREVRDAFGLHPVYKKVDTCAGEFAANTPYHYSSYDLSTEVQPREKPAVIILGSGPNRIGQGIEFDYSCVHAALTLKDDYDTIMVNCNPETVSTDYDIASRLYFEPLTFEDVYEVYRAELACGPVAGMIVQLGGQTPLSLARRLTDAGVPILGTQARAIDLAEDRQEFERVYTAAGVAAPAHGTATTNAGARDIAGEIGFPLLARPSYVLGGRGMEIIFNSDHFEDYLSRLGPDSAGVGAGPLLIDHFMDDAIEIDVDALYDGHELYLAGVMEHIEEAGIHSGDSACVLPPATLSGTIINQIRAATESIAQGVGTVGLINIQFALAAGVLNIIEANPRASRTVPFVAKATGVPLAKAAAKVMTGTTIAQLRECGMLPGVDFAQWSSFPDIAVKEVVLPFKRFRTFSGTMVDTILGPEMRSTGEAMGLGMNLPMAYAKSELATVGALPKPGKTIVVTVSDRDKRHIILPCSRLHQLGYKLVATEGTASVLERNGIPVTRVEKDRQLTDGSADTAFSSFVKSAEVGMVVNTPERGKGTREAGYRIRTAAATANKVIITTMRTLQVAVQVMDFLSQGQTFTVRSLQERQIEMEKSDTRMPGKA